MADFPVALSNVQDGPPGVGTEILAKHLNNLEAKVGIDASAVSTSLDYLLKNPASIEPGHKHDQLWKPDGSVAPLSINSYGDAVQQGALEIVVGRTGKGLIDLSEGYLSLAILIDSDNYSGLQFYGTSNVPTASPEIDLIRSRSNDGSTLASVEKNDSVGKIVFFADDGLMPHNSVGGIEVVVDGEPATFNIPGAIIFYTNPIGGQYFPGLERMRIDNSGLVGINQPSPVISDGIGLHIGGKIIRIDTQKTPATSGAAGNKGEFCVDNNYLYYCKDTNTWVRSPWSTF